MAAGWGVNSDHVTKLIHNGDLPAIDVSAGKKPRYLIHRSDVDDFELRRAVRKKS